MIWIISFFTLIGINFTIWSIIGIIRFYSEDRPQSKYIYTPPKGPPHSLVRWLRVFFDVTGIKLVWGIFFNTPRYTLKMIAKFWSVGKNILCKTIYYVKDSFIDPDLSPDFANAPEKITPIYCHSKADNLIQASKVNINEVAAIIPAHNEEATIGKTLKSLKKIMPAKNIYVGSDASTDNTVEIVKNFGCNVFDINPNKGKANVLTFLINHYELTKKYKAVIIVDADSEVDENYLKNSLPLFEDPKIVAVAAHAMSKWVDHWPPRADMIYTAYRVRLYRVLQAVFRYGQTWKHANVSMIIPGFASMYRTSVLPHININAMGLIIEDYNMTFELHHKNLGMIGYSPAVKGYSQDPLSFKDYFKQIKRWNLGFWQTIKKHGFWNSFFWISMSFYIFEILFFGAFLLIVPLFFLWFFVNSFEPILLPFTVPFLNFNTISFLDIIIGVFIIDYLITIFVSFYEKKPILLAYGLLFIILRYIDAFVLFYTIPLAFTTKSDGRWVSPKRKIVTT